MNLSKIEEWITDKIVQWPFEGYTEVYPPEGNLTEWVVILHYEYPDDMNYEYDGSTHWGRSVLKFKSYRDLIRHFKR